jgi:hypothetical protein
LSQDAAERAFVHVTSCPACRAAVAAERATRRRLLDAPDPAPSPELVARLLALGGPDGPLGPRPGHVPGTPRPAPISVAGPPWEHRRPAGRSDGVRPGGRRSRRSRLASVAVGAFSLASVGLLGLLLLGSTLGEDPGVSPVALGAAALGAGAAPTAAQDASTTGGAPEVTADRLDADELAALRDQGWPCPDALPDGLRLVEARHVSVDGAALLHLRYSDGTSTISVLEQQGRLAASEAAAFSQALAAGAQVSGRGDVPWHGVWQSGDVVVAVVADAEPDVVSRVVAALPHAEPADSWWEQVGDGAGVVGALLSDR